MIFSGWTKLPICNYKTHLLCLEDGFCEFWSRFYGDALIRLSLFNLYVISGFQNLQNWHGFKKMIKCIKKMTKTSCDWCIRAGSIQTHKDPNHSTWTCERVQVCYPLLVKFVLSRERSKHFCLGSCYRHTRVSKNILDASLRVFPAKSLSATTTLFPFSASLSNIVWRYFATAL